MVSHYGTKGDGTLGNRTACGKTVTFHSYWVAALKPRLAKCGKRLTIYYRGQRYRVTVQDRGAYRRDLRALDAAPGLRRAMGFRDLAYVTYREGWH